MSKQNEAPWWIRHLLLLWTMVFVVILLLVPLLNVLYEAFANGLSPYLSALGHRDTLHAAYLTGVVTVISVSVNTVFGIAAAWAVGKYEFRGKSLLITLIDLPFSVSPVISGLIFVLSLGLQSAVGRWLDHHHFQILYATPGIVIATVFVTFPFVVREVLPVMEAVGNDEEEAALTLGASPWQAFFWITLPNIKWGVIYGVLLCTARAMGEFGAVNVVSGRITGSTDTLSLRVEKLYQEYQTQAAFAVASLFLLLALVTLGIKGMVEARLKRTLEEAAGGSASP